MIRIMLLNLRRSVTAGTTTLLTVTLNQKIEPNTSYTVALFNMELCHALNSFKLTY